MGKANSKTSAPTRAPVEDTTIALGTKDTQRELLNYTTPTGIYKTYAWDKRLVRRAIIEKKLAPFIPGCPDPTSDEFEECPICFLSYPSLNRANCCRQSLCSECFLQVAPMVPGRAPKVECPFCKRDHFSITFRGPLTDTEREVIRKEQQDVENLQQKVREEEQRADRERAESRARASTSNTNNSITAASPLTTLPLPATPTKDVTGDSNNMNATASTSTTLASVTEASTPTAQYSTPDPGNTERAPPLATCLVQQSSSSVPRHTPSDSSSSLAESTESSASISESEVFSPEYQRLGTRTNVSELTSEQQQEDRDLQRAIQLSLMEASRHSTSV